MNQKNPISYASQKVIIYPFQVSFYPKKVHLVSVLSTKAAVLDKKMRYLFPPLLRYSSDRKGKQKNFQMCRFSAYLTATLLT